MTPAVDMPDVCDCHGVPTLLVDVPGGWRRVCVETLGDWARGRR